MSKRKHLNYIISAALIAAAYAALTFLSGVFGLAFGPVQLRLSEVLTILPVFTPAAIPGLAVGCFISNIGSFNVIDMVFGTLATLAAAFLTYYLRNVKFKGVPFLALLPPVIINAVVIGFEIAIFFMPDTSFIWAFLISAAQIGISQFIVCFIFGIPFYLAFNKYNIFEKISSIK